MEAIERVNEFVTRYDTKRDWILDQFRAKHPDAYEDVVKVVIEAVTVAGDSDYPDPSRMHTLNDGDYQGTLVFIIGAYGYQPDKYWYVKVSYGSCSGCDTLQSIREWKYEKPTEEQAKQYATLALHVLQSLRPMQ